MLWLKILGLGLLWFLRFKHSGLRVAEGYVEGGHVSHALVMLLKTVG